MTDAIALRTSLNLNVAERSRYEREKSASETITNQLVKHFSLNHKTLETKLSDDFFEKIAASHIVDSFDFINSHDKANQRFNIKALEKVRAKLDSIVADKIMRFDTVSQKFCIACVLTCLRNRESDSFVFTRKHALAMLSRALRFDTVKIRDLATKFDVAESTASTQVSSSFRTLDALKVLRFSEESSQRAIVSHVDFEHAFVKLIERDLLEKK